LKSEGKAAHTTIAEFLNSHGSMVSACCLKSGALISTGTTAINLLLGTGLTWSNLRKGLVKQKLSVCVCWSRYLSDLNIMHALVNVADVVVVCLFVYH